MFTRVIVSRVPGERHLPAPGPVLRAKWTAYADVENETSAGEVVLRAADRRHVRQVEMNGSPADTCTAMLYATLQLSDYIFINMYNVFI